jgi:hypothetical protein
MKKHIILLVFTIGLLFVIQNSYSTITPIQIKEDTVTKIVTSKNSILISRQYKIGKRMSWLRLIKPTGSTAPTLSDFSNNGVKMFSMDPVKEIIQTTSLIDVYVICNDGGAPGEYGKLEVWTDYQNTFNPNGGIDTYIQDQTTRPLDLYFLKALGALANIDSTTATDDTTITIDATAGFSVGDQIGVTSPRGQFYFGDILNIVGFVVYLDTPIDSVFIIGDNVFNATKNMAVDGSSSTQIFSIRGPSAGSAVDITRLLMQCQTTDAIDLSKFADIAGGLTKGIVLRKNDGVVTNIFNAKTNAALANLAYDFTVRTATNPAQGQNGFLWRYTFGGQDKHGVVIRLQAGESLELLIQDDLSDIIEFTMIGAGHIVD